ncbi:MAG: hypothetical protein PHR73_02345 [Candidatus Omnitrophica bacterium]|nr:hypothetical protein [Candidatus Omnitrophota bacterium]
MSFQLILIAALIIAGFVIWNKWYTRKINERNRENHISDQLRSEENARLEERQKLRTEERAVRDKEERKVQLAQEADLAKIRAERDFKENELRQKIRDRKKNEAEEEKRKAEGGKAA